MLIAAGSLDDNGEWRESQWCRRSTIRCVHAASRVAGMQGKRGAGSDSIKQFMFALLYQKTSQFPSKVYKPTADALKEPAFLR